MAIRPVKLPTFAIGQPCAATWAAARCARPPRGELLSTETGRTATAGRLVRLASTLVAAWVRVGVGRGAGERDVVVAAGAAEEGGGSNAGPASSRSGLLFSASSRAM